MKRGAAVLLLALSAAAPDAVPEPAGYWLGAPQGRVPDTVAGGAVIHTEALAALVTRGDAVLVDVLPAPRRPPNQAATMPWLPLPHRSLPGAVWIPGAGLGALTDELDVYYRDRLDTLTGHDRDRAVVVFCKPQCWMSWNAAKRAIAAGYRHVLWYPGGVEEWQQAGLPTAPATPEGPDAK